MAQAGPIPSSRELGETYTMQTLGPSHTLISCKWQQTTKALSKCVSSRKSNWEIFLDSMAQQCSEPQGYLF